MANQPMTAGKSARRARLGRLNATVAAVLAAGLPAGAWAQNIILRNVESLGQLVVTAAGFEQAVADAPASISVITAEDLESGSYTNLADALSEVQGVAITGTGNERDIQIRGLPGAYTLVLVDGRRQSTRESRTNGSSGYEQSFLPPLEQIERIEVVRGPMSSLYGSDAMGGVVNVITRPVGDRWTGSVSAETTVQQHDDRGDGRQLSFSVGGPVIAGRLGLQLWGRVSHRDEDTRTDAAGAVVDGLNGARNRDIGARLTFTPVAGHELRLEGGSQRLRAISQHNTSSLWGGAVTRRDHDRDYVALGYSGTFGSTMADLSLQREEGSRTVYTGNPETPNVRVPRVANTVLDGRLTAPWTFAGQHTLVTGFQFTDVAVNDIGHGTTPQDIGIRQWAVYAENEWQIGDTFSVTGGLRYDHHSIYGGHLSPRLYAVWRQSDALTIKGGISTGFRAPDVRQVAPGYYMPTQQGAGLIAPNATLRPESSMNIELGAVYEGARFSASATAFYTRFNDKISNMATGRLIDPNTGDIIDPLGGAACNAAALGPYPGYYCLWQNFNIDNAVVRGVELSGDWRATDTLSLRASYALTDSEQRTGQFAGFPLQRTPRHRATLRADWQAPLDGLDLWGAVTYHGAEINAGARIGTAGTPIVINGQPGRRYDPYTTLDIGTSYAVNDRVSVAAAVYNVFDTAPAVDEVNTVIEGRRFWLGVTSRF